MTAKRKPAYLVGLIGSGIQASLSPAMHEGEGDRHGFLYLYQLIDLDRLGLDATALPQLLEAAELIGFAGLNITHPCKQAVIPLLDELSDDAAAIGAVNTVVFRDGRRIGHNTDCLGFEQSMREDLDSAARRRVLLVGAGGAGAAVAHALLRLGVDTLLIHDIEPARAESLAGAVVQRFGTGRALSTTDLEASIPAVDGVVHATPTGMTHHPGLPFNVEFLKPSQWVAEIVYFPLETELLRAARRLGCRTVDGRGMAVHQAAGAFRLFTGRAADPARMRADFEALIDWQRSITESTATAV